MTRSLLTGSLIKGSLVAATAAMVASVFAAPTALADDRRCTGTIGAISIDGNLQCKSNNPAPTGGNNRVQGNKEDQCRNL